MWAGGVQLSVRAAGQRKAHAGVGSNRDVNNIVANGTGQRSPGFLALVEINLGRFDGGTSHLLIWKTKLRFKVCFLCSFGVVLDMRNAVGCFMQTYYLSTGQRSPGFLDLVE